MAEQELFSSSSDSLVYYDDPRSHYRLQEKFIKDEERTKTFINAIEENSELFKGKVVLNINCGLGLLAMIAARAGAKKVIAIDSSNITFRTRKVIEQNQLGKVISVVHGKVSDLDLKEELGDEKADILLSDWAGNCLLWDSALPQVIEARDKWLKEDGLIFPDKAIIKVLGFEDKATYEDQINCWSNLCGFNFTRFHGFIFHSPSVDVIDGSKIFTDTVTVKEICLKTINLTDCKQWASSVKITATRNGTLHYIGAFFDLVFSLGKTPLTLSTGPLSKPTFWKQTCFSMEKPVHLNSGESAEAYFAVHFNPNNTRDITVTVGAAEKENTASSISNSFKFYPNILLLA